MAIDYTSMIYGNRTAEQPKRTTGQGAREVNYDELYRQANQGNFSNMSANISGSAAGSADFLADYARRNNQVQQAGMTSASFNPLLGPEGMVNLNAPIVNVNKSSQQIFDEAQAKYLETATASRDLTRQGIQRTGADQYSQARMAMEQQMALSDTRGLTAGAREGAQQTLSATQQVALNQIESNIQSQLLELKAQGVQDEFLGQEYAMRKLDQFKQTDPQWGQLESLGRDYQDAITRGDAEGGAKIRQQMANLEGQLLGFANIDGYTPPTSDMSLDDLDADVRALAERISKDPSGFDKLAVAGLFLGGTALLIGGIVAAPFTAGTSLGASVKGSLMIVGAAGAYVTGTYITAVEVDQTMSTEDKKAKIDAAYAQERARLIDLGYPPADVDRIIAEARIELPPALR